jgi:hypothetical protein
MSLEGWTTPANKATIYAHELINKFRKERENAIELERQSKLWPEYLMCNDCKRHGITKKYHRDTMLHTPYVINRIRRGKREKVTMYVHRCPKCGKAYRPQKERAGHAEGL